MKLSDFVNAAVSLYETKTSAHLESPPGVGKSSVIRFEVIAALEAHYGEKFGLVEEYLSQIDGPDLRGFMVPTKNEQGQAVAMYTLPNILVRINEQVAKGFKRGILFLDERNQADHLVQKAAAPVILEGRVGDHYIPEGWWVVSASNRVQDGAGAQKPLSHLTNREDKLNIEFDLAGLLAWGTANNVHPLTLAYWKARPGNICAPSIPKDGKPFSSPRSQVMVDKILRQRMTDPNAPHLPDDEVSQTLCAGLVGEAQAADQFGYYKVANELPTKEDMERDPDNAKRPKDDRIDAQYAAMQMAVYHANGTNVNNMFRYVRRLNKELQVSAAKAMLEKDGGALLNSTELGDFIAKNRALVMATIAGS